MPIELSFIVSIFEETFKNEWQTNWILVIDHIYFNIFELLPGPENNICHQARDIIQTSHEQHFDSPYRIS